MNPFSWIKLFAEFANIAGSVVESFAEKHPELRDPPPEDNEKDIYKAFLAQIEERFHSDK